MSQFRKMSKKGRIVSENKAADIECKWSYVACDMIAAR
jgi:hypothetical protein